jgi:hypothetical protein
MGQRTKHWRIAPKAAFSVQTLGHKMKKLYIPYVALCFLAMVHSAHTASSSNRVSYVRYANLQKDAELVLIGRATATSRTGVQEVFHDPHHSVTCEQVRTSFKVRLVLKGTNQSDRLEVIHFQKPESAEPFCWLGPKLASFITPQFDPSNDLGGATNGPIPEYLLFLKHHAAGHYVPVSGQRNADYSLREVYGHWNKPSRHKDKTQQETERDK